MTRIFLRSLIVLALFAAVAAAQVHTSSGSTLMVVPFENRSGAPGLDWIGEAFSQVLGQRLAAPGTLVIGRADRLYAFDRLGLPSDPQLTRATLYRIADEMDLDYLVLGSYRYDGQTFSAEGQVFDVKRLRLLPRVSASGPLQQLLAIQNNLAWDLARQMDPRLPIPRATFLANAPVVRLDAFENFLRGVLATQRSERLRYLREAVRIDPAYSEAQLRLGHTYFETREYDAAVQAYSKVPQDASVFGEASFYMGLAHLYRGQHDRAEAAFRTLAERVPLTEVINNLGVALARQGKRAAVEQFQAAVQNDPRDADYRFNLAVTLYRAGDANGTARQLRESLAIRPDPEVRTFLDQVMSGTAGTAAPLAAAATSSSTPAPAPRLPLTRVKRNYDEASFRQLAMEIQNAREESLKDVPAERHAAAHVEQGQQMMRQRFYEQAEREFREAILLDPVNAAAHLGLAEMLERRSDLAAARAEASAALRLQPSSAAYVLLARVQLKQEEFDEAAESARQALALEPGNAAAAELQRTIAAKLAEKGQPLRQQ